MKGIDVEKEHLLALCELLNADLLHVVLLIKKIQLDVSRQLHREHRSLCWVQEVRQQAMLLVMLSESLPNQIG